ncbi:oxidoreductase [Streptomyces sp. NPDC007983]|uniref:oxidoreductase n=1 Tax=Streptomyces sp. NPDC007983 TaxID=3364800 RepID=UPI0036E09693
MVLTEPERRLREAFATGAKVDVRDAATAEEPETDGPGWGPERTVRAEVIRTLLLGGADTRPGETPVVHLVGARVTGRLKLVFAEACCVLRLEKCWFEQAPQLYGAALRVTGFGGSYLPGLAINTATVAGNLDLMRTRIRGMVNLANARIDGSLLLQGAWLSHPGGVALDGSRLEAASGIVGREGFRAEGEIRLREARVGEALRLEGAYLHHPGGDALCAESIQVGTRIDCGDGFRAEGAIALTDATVGRAVSFRGATVEHPTGHALAAGHLQVPELDLRATHWDGAIDLRHGRLDVPHLPTGPSAPALRLDGLTYRALEPHLPADRCLALVERDPDGYRPQPYQQLAAIYQAIGHDDDARAILLAKQRRRRATLRPLGRAWGRLLDATVGYGYRPWLAGLWLTALTLLGTAVFRAAHPKPVKPGEGAPFSPLVYTLDLLIPVGGLGQRNAWYWPAGPVQWLAYVLIAAGWLLTTAVVAGVTRVLNRS